MLFLILLSGLEFTWLDLWIRPHFYDAELHRWIYQESRLAETGIHLGGRYFTYISAVAMLGCLLASFSPRSSFRRYRRELTFLLVASISGPIIIALLKSSTHIYCPWSLALFGASQQVRGAHFFSHDLFSLAVCWFSSAVLFVLFFRKQLRWM